MYFKFALKKTGDPSVTYDYDSTTSTQMPTSDIQRTDVGLEIEKTVRRRYNRHAKCKQEIKAENTANQMIQGSTTQGHFNLLFAHGHVRAAVMTAS
jgi:hypothetical protein